MTWESGCARLKWNAVMGRGDRQKHIAFPGDRVTRVDSKEAQVEKYLIAHYQHAGNEENRGKMQWGSSSG